MGLQRASTTFGITRKAFLATGAFDPVVGVDSLFFVDPLRLRKSPVPEFGGAFERLRRYYRIILTLLRSRNATARNKALKLLRLPELRGVGIGYSDKSDDGSAIGKGLATRLADTAVALLDMGIDDPAVFEVMGLFEEDFGPDRLSDSVISILQAEVYAYTIRIADELQLPRKHTVRAFGREYRLPEHPLGGKPLLLLPRRLLRALPIAHSFDEIHAAAHFNEELRRRFNALLADIFKDGQRPPKSAIRSYLLADAERMRTVVEAYESAKPEQYDFKHDPAGLSLWLEKAKAAWAAFPATIPKTHDVADVAAAVEKMISAFKGFVEARGGWRGMYNDAGEVLNERHARLYFYAIALEAQHADNVDISPESNAGQGPVDFKVSRGSRVKVVVEVKLSSGKVHQGYTKQTGLYQKAEGAGASYFVVLQVTKRSAALERVLREAARDERESVKHPTVVVIDATPKKSASRA